MSKICAEDLLQLKNLKELEDSSGGLASCRRSRIDTHQDLERVSETVPTNKMLANSLTKGKMDPVVPSGLFA